MTYEEAKKTIALGQYRHFKGKEYEVLAIARHSETKEPMVVYKALYNDEAYGDGAVWVRPAAMWNEEIEAKNFSLISSRSMLRKGQGWTAFTSLIRT